MSELSIEYGLILLKCRGCKAPTLFRLEIRHEADSRTFTAKTCCSKCEQEDPLRSAWARELKPKLVDNQRIDSGGTGDFRHEPNGGESSV